MSDETLQARAEHYNADLPDGVILLTAAVDVQDDRFEIEVRGWAREYETWGIVKTELYGDLVKKPYGMSWRSIYHRYSILKMAGNLE